jgi:hypothetical protein
MNVETAGRSANGGGDQGVLDASAEYQRATGEAIEATLDIDSWLPADRYIETIGRLQREIDASLADAAATNAAIREKILPALKGRQGAPSCGGHFKTDMAALREVHRDVLFNGLVFAVDGTSVVFQKLP